MADSKDLIDAGSDARLAILRAVKEGVDDLVVLGVRGNQDALLTLAETYAWAMSTDQPHGGGGRRVTR